MRAAARAGLATRGILYVLIGWLAIEIAVGHQGQQADRSGALRIVAGTRAGGVLLWLLVAGFICLAVWRLAEAAYGSPGAAGHKTSARLKALGSAIIYGFVAYGTIKYALGAGAPPSTNQQSVDLTATAMREPGGRLIVVVLGLALIGGGLYLGYQSWRRKFLSNLRTSQMRARTRRVVEWLGVAGGLARAVVFTVAGIFLVVAAAKAQPGQAKGIDSSLRTLATTPLGPWLLALVAIGLIMFGLYSCCEARWFKG
jgi:type IV secretory pathway VirB2 component (pilin)